MKVKICGITNAEDALNAVEIGADAIGFIFVKASPRYVAPESAYQIIQNLPPFVIKVGVFADATKDEITDIINYTGINCLQLHGNEAPDFIRNFRMPVIKSFRVKTGFELSILGKYNTSAFLLDTFAENQIGGTGKTFDWNIAIEAKKYGKIILAGGLNENNIMEAIRTVQPYAVDINSGVEAEPGKKDKEKIRKLFRIIRELERELYSKEKI